MSAVSLTEEQRVAVARRAEPLLLSAAAGSGKTSVLVERFVAAIREDGVAPSRILAITFTERAAGELRARVRARLLELGDRDAARDTEAALMGTFHGFCARLLRGHPLAAGLDPAFTILDEGLAGRLREQAFAIALREFLAGGRAAQSMPGQALDTIAAYGIERTRAMIEQVYAELRSRGQRSPRLPPASAPRGEEQADPTVVSQAERVCALFDELLGGFANAYEELKRVRGAVDFDDLELLARELLLEHDELRRAWRERFELLMVDEFQDTNPRQLDILAALEQGNLFTVGDELQSIYGFRHADVSLFRARRDELEELGGSLRLTRNFRSREALLHVVNAVFAERFPDYAPLRAGREDAASSASRAPAGVTGQAPPEAHVELLLSDIRGWEAREDLAPRIAAGMPHAQLWRQAEARLLAQRVAALVREGAALAGEVVVLLRAAGDLEVFERALQLQGLRTLAAVGAFWGHQQIADLIAWLRALANPLDEQALYGALASPLAGCSLDCLAALSRGARETRRGVWETALDAARATGPVVLDDADRRALCAFCELLAEERRGASLRSISEAIERAIAASGYREHVLTLDWPERRLANVHKLLRLARRYEADQGRDLRGFLDHVAYLEQAAQVEPDAPVEGVVPDAVRLMTIHAAKGLEFPVVCLADLGRQPYTQTPDLLVDGERVGLRLVGLDGGGSTPALHYEALARERREREAEEEDRVLYVAMTRARERLLLSGAADFSRWALARPGATPISWLVPALSSELPALAQAATDAPVQNLVIGAGDAAVSVRCWLSTPATVGEVLRLNGFPGGGSGEAGVADVEDGQLALFAEDPPMAERDLRVVAPSPAPTARRAPSAPDRTLAASANAEQALASTLSYTSLSELERCGYRYYLERVLGLPEQAAADPATPRHRGLEARARGTLIHRLMELELARPRATSQPLAVLPERVGEVARRMAMRVGREERAEIAALITAAGDAPPIARLAGARSLRREYPFAFPAGPEGTLMTGVIDLLAQEANGGYLVLDYKSDRLEPDTDLEALVEERYSVQRELYALALLRTGADTVEVVHWFLERPAEWVLARFHAGDRAALQKSLQARIARASERGFAVSQRPHRELCSTCPGRGGLCSWGEAEALRKNPYQEPIR
jgi:ATP-dependent exoDNAse (exonuclease V) beta subunit